MSTVNSPSIDLHSPKDSTTPSKLNAPKNKQCPFCGDQFTSSSLGRHLDLFIKEKNPKNADGVHDVEKIRQIRSNITRRQPRRSTKQHEVSTPNTSAGQNSGASPFSFTVGVDKNQKILINRPTWEATGVITDIPTNGVGLDMSARKQLTRSDVALRKRMIEERTRLRAAELALQEVLDSVNAAR
jgi:hypothetical protein